MSAVACSWCDCWIDRSNNGHAGYCSPQCRDRDHADRLLRRETRKAERRYGRALRRQAES